MGQYILSGNPPIEIHLRQSAQAKRLSLRVSGLDGRVTLTMPRGVSEKEALIFAREKAGWLRGHVGARPETVTVAPGEYLPFLGQERQIIAAEGRKVLVQADTITVPGGSARMAARLLGFLKLAARDRLAEASDDYAARLGRSYSSLSLRDTRSRWGSCSSQGALMYSWRLVMAPSEVLSYVAAHEVAHLAEMNHSPAFWAIVRDLYGDEAAPRRWLRTHGNTLHRYRF